MLFSYHRPRLPVTTGICRLLASSVIPVGVKIIHATLAVIVAVMIYPNHLLLHRQAVAAMVVRVAKDIIRMEAMDRLPLLHHHQVAAKVVEVAAAISQVVTITTDALLVSATL
jgi:hypothetical protein